MSNLHKLSNGLRIVFDKMESVETCGFGIWACIGTRHEALVDNGAAHMVEHMLFKGTKRRNALEISSAIEDVGGNMNAYTGRELTGYYCHLLKDDLLLAIDVLSDMILNSTMPLDELNREKGVILQELKMYQDSPDDLVGDYFFEAAYPHQSLGSNGLGTIHSIQNMSREILMQYVEHKYSPQNLVISVSGNFEEASILKTLEDIFGELEQKKPHETIKANYSPQDKIIDKQTEQTHIMVGFEAPHRHDADFHAARVAAMVLGGGMSSRLFQEIREKRGLVYSISSSYDVLIDHALFGFYAGTGSEHVKELMPASLEELKKLASETVSADELKRAKTQMKTGVLMGRERVMSRCDQNARSVIHFGKAYNPKESIQKIEAVTAEDIKRVMEKILSTKPVMASVGSTEHIMKSDEIASLIRN